MPRTSAGDGVLLKLLALTSGCAIEQAAPGAATARLTRTPADVSNCTAVGNVKDYAPNGTGDEVKFRNQVISYGGNVGLVTVSPAYGKPSEDIAYRCATTSP
jgi:hypothetical protein